MAAEGRAAQAGSSHRAIRTHVLIVLLLGWLMPSAAWAQTCSAAALGAGAGSIEMHVPASLPIGRPAPLLVLLHGSNGTGAAILRESGLGLTADRHGFVVIAPDGGMAAGSGFVWNIPGVPTVSGALPASSDRDDVAFILSAVDRLVRSRCVDRARVYVTGLSGGGRMASWLGCVAAKRFAAIAPVVGLRAGRPSASDPASPDPASCRPAVPMPVLAFAGDADTTNPIVGGGAPYWRYPMHAAEQRWAGLNGCTAAPTTRWITGSIYEERYGGCAGGADVAVRVTRGGEHSWAVADNEAMWAFLSRHRR